MISFKKAIMWLYMLTKKHLYRWSFPLLLILTIVSGPVLNNVFSESEGIVKVALYPGEDKLFAEVCNSLVSEKSAIKYTVVKSKNEAIKLVESGKCDTAWIAKKDFAKRIESIARDDKIIPVIDVYQRENSIALELSRGKLYGKTFSYLTYEMYKDYVLTEIATDGSISEERIKQVYDNTGGDESVIRIKNEDSGDTLDALGANYLLSPIRGFLSILVFLCGIAAGIYFVSEKKKGLYSRIRQSRHYLPAFGSCFGVILLSGMAALCSLAFSNLFTRAPFEIANMLLFCICTGLFCTFLCAIVGSVPLFGALIVPMVIIILIMCPIFFNADFFIWAKYLLPNYYYLMSVYNPEYMLYSLIYIAAVAMVIRGVYALKKQ